MNHIAQSLISEEKKNYGNEGRNENRKRRKGLSALL